jgi:hypothetical protein
MKTRLPPDALRNKVALAKKLHDLSTNYTALVHALTIRLETEAGGSLS